MKRKYCLSFILSFLCLVLIAQNKIDHIEPPNWWAGMNHPEVQLMVHGKNISSLKPSIDYPGLRIKQVIQVESPNYLFIDVHMSEEVKPGMVRINFLRAGSTVLTQEWELKQREPDAANRTTFDQSDVLYLITPDRFANGDSSNDMVAGMRENPNRGFKGGRHGGDIEGIRKNLDYIADLGFTAIWLNPVLENDMVEYSYHGYSTTDFYKVDPRFGSNEAYKKLADEARSKGVKLIMDMIVNHCGSYHWWMSDLPSKDWINQWPEYTETNHRKTLVQDPYASKKDQKQFTDGWFVPTMPDMNQNNPLMANYLTQNAIWWIEYLGLAGIRMDTYPYPDMDYMTEWTRRVDLEYPGFNVVGEEWYNDPAIVAYWQENKQNPNGYSSDLRSLMDFPVQVKLVDALNEKEGWGSGWISLYEMLAKDFMYADANELVVFPDNHDMKRFYSQINEDFHMFQNGMVFTATVRGVPQVYYGTEILMTSDGDHGIIRSDFPGGWQGDATNAFTGKGLTPQQLQTQAFVKKLLTWRKKANVIHHGELMHFIPKDGVYVFFRYDENDKVMVILNKNDQPYTLELDRFSEILPPVSKVNDVLNDKSYVLKKTIQLEPGMPMILEIN